LCPTRFQAVSGIEPPEKGSSGREKWKAAEELWQEDGSVLTRGRAEEGMRYIQRAKSSFPQKRESRVFRAPLGSRFRGSDGKGTMPRRIAIVEDDAAIRANYADALRKHGYEVSAHASRGQAMGAFRTRLPDLAVIDIGLGEEPDGGFALCRELRALAPALPILFLTARDSDFDAVSGLRLGADDYLTKDVSLPHLLARISALFRRIDALREPKAAEEVLERGGLKLDAKRFTASWKDKPVELTLTEFWMVHTLAKFPGHVKDREGLMRDANLVVDEGTITSHVKRIRRKFAAVDPAFEQIDTVYGMGYRWKA
jgi:two-component system OmpR family response regulator